MKFSELRKDSVNKLIFDLNLNNEVEPVGSGIYLSYPDFFYKLLLNKDVNFNDIKQTKFCLASFLMFKFLTQTDNIIDNQNINKIDTLKKPILSYNLSMRLLSNLFELNSKFWFFFEKRQTQYIECVYHEKIEISNQFKLNSYNSQLSLDYYSEYYTKKCSFSSIAIDGIYILNQESSTNENFQLSHKINDEFNFVFCVLDDVEDFRKDIGLNQMNFAHHYFINKNRVLINDIDKFLNKSVDEFYTSGIAIEILDFCKKKMNSSLNELNKFSFTEDLSLLLEIKLTDLTNKLNIISEYTK